MSRVALFVALGFGLGMAAPARAIPAPSDEIKAVFTKDQQVALCGAVGAADTVRRGALLGQLAMAYKINVLDLPDLKAVPADAVVPHADSDVGRLAAWIIARRKMAEPGQVKVSADFLDAIDHLGDDLASYLEWLAAHPTGQSYRVGPASVPSGADHADLLVRFLAPLAGADAEVPPMLFCDRPAPSMAAKGQPPVGGTAPGKTTSPMIEVAVRGKIDDLATPGTAMKRQKDAAYKAASSATFAFTDDFVKGQENVAIDATLGVGIASTRAYAILAFVHYSQSTSVTSGVSDAKNIRALSPGIFLRHSVQIGSDARNIGAILGLAAYPTFDFAQHARTGRIRLMLDDIAVNLWDGPPLCGEERGIGTAKDGKFPLVINCRAQLYFEGAHVWKAGTSIDLATLDDDQYLGLGGDLQLAASLPSSDALKPFSLTAEYRYMTVVSGGLHDPHRLSLGLAYKPTDSDLTFGIAYDVGANFDTFQRERVTKVTVGYKY